MPRVSRKALPAFRRFMSDLPVAGAQNADQIHSAAPGLEPKATPKEDVEEGLFPGCGR